MELEFSNSFMNQRMLIFYGILLLTSTIFGCSSKNSIQNSDKSQNAAAVTEKSPGKTDKISDEDKLQIIGLIIDLIKVNSKPICVDKQPIYFSRDDLSMNLRVKFPAKIKDCPVILKDEGEMGRGFKYNYQKFYNWKIEEKFIYVTFSTNFSGGNIGLGTYKLSKEQKKWIIVSSDFGAAAS